MYSWSRTLDDSSQNNSLRWFPLIIWWRLSDSPLWVRVSHGHRVCFVSQVLTKFTSCHMFSCPAYPAVLRLESHRSRAGCSCEFFLLLLLLSAVSWVDRDHTLRRQSRAVVLLWETGEHILDHLPYISSFICQAAGVEVSKTVQRLVLVKGPSPLTPPPAPWRPQFPSWLTSHLIELTVLPCPAQCSLLGLH